MMDGIFGVGLAEMMIIALALFIIGGPKNTAKWARQLGEWARQGRQAWAQVMADLENELGPEGKELMDTARELGKGAREISSMGSPKRLVGDALRMVETAVELDDEPASAPDPMMIESGSPSEADPQEAKASSNGKKYNAWLPPDKSE